ncbi:MAG: hypothetical protein HY013_03140 [Candidatus Solibacter usitatus]|nr:hypothetical protein [Candidatus Solibacter usitatus]
MLDLLSQSLGIAGQRRNGLARLAGAWTGQDVQQFLKNTAPLRKPDPDLWR